MLGWFPPDPPLPLSPPFSDLPLSRTCWLWSLLLCDSWFWLWFDPVSLSVCCKLWFCTEDGLGCPVLFPLSMFESSLAIWLRLSLRKFSRIVNLESAEVVVFPCLFVLIYFSSPFFEQYLVAFWWVCFVFCFLHLPLSQTSLTCQQTLSCHVKFLVASFCSVDLVASLSHFLLQTLAHPAKCDGSVVHYCRGRRNKPAKRRI